MRQSKIPVLLFSHYVYSFIFSFSQSVNTVNYKDDTHLHRHPCPSCHRRGLPKSSETPSETPSEIPSQTDFQTLGYPKWHSRHVADSKLWLARESSFSRAAFVCRSFFLGFSFLWGEVCVFSPVTVTGAANRQDGGKLCCGAVVLGLLLLTR